MKELTAAQEKTARRANRRMCRNTHLIFTNDMRFYMQVAQTFKNGKDNRKK